MRHQLERHHKHHLVNLGIPNVPDALEISDQEYAQHREHWKVTLPDADEATLREQSQRQEAAIAALREESQQNRQEQKQQHRKAQRGATLLAIVCGLGLLLLFLLLAIRPAHAQATQLRQPAPVTRAVNHRFSRPNVAGGHQSPTEEAARKGRATERQLQREG